MNRFQSAVTHVHEVLAQRQARGEDLRCAREALDRLREVAAGGQKPEFKEAYRGTRPEGLVVSAGESPEVEMPGTTVRPTEEKGLALPATVKRLTPEERVRRMEELRTGVLVCQKCPQLARTRTQVVFGVGDPSAELMFVGEAPGEDEDLQGEPFVGKAGQLLTRIIETMGFPRGSVYIANVLKCRPDMPQGETGNRKPRLEEMRTCLPYLREQIGIIQPRVLVALGATAMEGLLGETEPMARLRGRWHEFSGIPLMATYHPAYLLRNQSLGEKRKVWEDLLLVLERLERPISEKQRRFFLAKE
jgi:uracil-DNA glycosylase family 4